MSIEVPFILLFIGILIFFFWKWFLKKFIQNEKKRKIATWIITICSTPIIYVLIIIIWIFSVSYHPSNDFDKQKWMTDKEKRYEISEDLIDSEILIGKTKKEVRQILGDEANEENTDENNYWTYYLGFKPRLFNIDPDMLNIEFKNGKVINVTQYSG